MIGRFFRDRMHSGPLTHSGVGWATIAPAFVLALLGTIAPCAAQPQGLGPAPDALKKAGIDEKLDNQIPLDLAFRDEDGRDVTLASYIDGERPAILSLNYSDCPMLCTLVLNGLVDSLKELSWTPGQEFEIVSVSIDPTETPQRARLSKQKYVKDYGRPGSARGWHFLTGRQENIERLADAVGFRYSYVEERKEYAHAAVIMVCTPDGRVSRYLYGIQFPTQTVKLSLVEAGEGKVGSTLDKVLLYCFHYDATSGRYGPVAQNIMKLGGGLMLMVLLVGLVPYWLRRHARQTRQAAGSANGGSLDADSVGARADSSNAANDDKRTGPSRKVLAGLLPPLLAPLLGSPGGSLFFPQRGSSDAVIVDQIFYFILIISIVFFVLIVAVMLLFVFKYRRTDHRTPEKTATHSNALEALWSIIPAILVAIIFIWGFSGYMEMRQAPDDSYEIQVIAQKWSWSFQYPNGHIEPDLHVPADTNIRLVMTSTDVIHSLYIPAFRLKMDVVPGRFNKTWFKAIDPGSETKEYDLLCAEYCGDKHSTMTAKVVVHPSGEFETWLEDAANFLDRMTPEEAGELLYRRRLCSQCHSLDGAAGTGPTFKGIFAAEHEMTNGEKVTVDENYIQESIWDPQAKVRSGYKPVMPTYRDQLKEEEVRAIIAFIKTLK